MAMKKEEARQAVLSEYDGWAKKHPRQALPSCRRDADPDEPHASIETELT